MKYEYTRKELHGIIDGRYLAFDLDFYDLSENESLSLLRNALAFFLRITENNVNGIWNRDERRSDISKYGNPLKDFVGLNRYMDFEGQITDDMSPESKREYLRASRNPHSLTGVVSEDYYEYYEKHILAAETPAELRRGMIDLFNVEKRHFIIEAERLLLPDVYFCLEAFDWFKNKIYHGKIRIFLGVFCLGKYTTEMANVFADYLRQIGVEYRNVNGRITLTWSPFLDPVPVFAQYFAVPPAGSTYGQQGPEFMNRSLYCSGIEWANLVAPAIIKKHRIEAKDNETLYLQATDDIMNYEAKDLAEIKRIIGPALKPGWRSISLKQAKDINTIDYMKKPRSHWEIMLLDEDEIVETEDGIMYCFMP